MALVSASLEKGPALTEGVQRSLPFPLQPDAAQLLVRPTALRRGRQLQLLVDVFASYPCKMISATNQQGRNQVHAHMDYPLPSEVKDTTQSLEVWPSAIIISKL